MEVVTTISAARQLAACGRIDTLIHCATSYGRKGETPGEIAQANIIFPVELLKICATQHLRHLINIDTVLPPSISEYARTKAEFRQQATQIAKDSGIALTNLRLEYMYGPGDDDSKFTTHVIRACLRNDASIALTKGEQERDFIYIEDVVSAISLIAENVSVAKRYVEFDIGSGESVTLKHFAIAVRALTNSSTRFDFGAIPYRDNEIMRSCADSSRLRALGWRCAYTLVRGLSDTIHGERNK